MEKLDQSFPNLASYVAGEIASETRLKILEERARGVGGNGNPLGLHPGIIGSSPIPSTKILPALNESNSNQIRNRVNITMMSGSKGASFVFEIGE